MASITAQRNELALNKVKWLEEIFDKAGIEYYRTGGNLSTLTFDCGQIEGQQLYGSIKFTLHKANYNLDDEIEEFEMLLEEKEKKEKEKERQKEKALKEKKRKEDKAAAKKILDERTREKRRQYLASLQKSSSEENSKNEETKTES